MNQAGGASSRYALVRHMSGSAVDNVLIRSQDDVERIAVHVVAHAADVDRNSVLHARLRGSRQSTHQVHVH